MTDIGDLCKAYKEVEKDIQEIDAAGSEEDFLEQKEISLDWDEEAEVFTISKGGRFVVSFRYTLIDAFADILCCKNGLDTILYRILNNTNDLYGINGNTLLSLNNKFKNRREVILETLPPVLREELDYIRYSEKIRKELPVVDDSVRDWRVGKSPEEIDRIEKEFLTLENMAQDNSCFLADGDTLIWLGPNKNREEKIAIYESYKSGRTYDVSESEVKERDAIKVKEEEKEVDKEE